MKTTFDLKVCALALCCAAGALAQTDTTNTRPSNDPTRADPQDHMTDVQKRKHDPTRTDTASGGTGIGTTDTTGRTGNMGNTGNTGIADSVNGTAQAGRDQLKSLARIDQKFVEEAAEGGLAEVKLSELAEQQSIDPEVKQFARMMIDDHSKANNELKELANRRGVTLPTAMSPKVQSHYDALSKLSGSKLDREYVRIMLDDHQKAVRLFEKQARRGDDAELRSWAQKTLPALNHHLVAVQQLEKELKTRMKAASR